MALLLGRPGRLSRAPSRPHQQRQLRCLEAQFKTQVPVRLPETVRVDRGGLGNCDRLFFGWYNYKHKHSGIGLHTPADVHHACADLASAGTAPFWDTGSMSISHLERFVRKPPEPPRATGLQRDQPTTEGGPADFNKSPLRKSCLRNVDRFALGLLTYPPPPP